MKLLVLEMFGSFCCFWKGGFYVVFVGCFYFFGKWFVYMFLRFGFEKGDFFKYFVVPLEKVLCMVFVF